MNRAVTVQLVAAIIILLLIGCGGGGSNGGGSTGSGSVTSNGDGLTPEEDAAASLSPSVAPIPLGQELFPDGISIQQIVDEFGLPSPGGGKLARKVIGIGRGPSGPQSPADFKKTCIAKMIQMGDYLVGLTNAPGQSGFPGAAAQTKLAYSFGSKQYTAPAVPKAGCCTETLYGLDCSGLVYQCALFAGLSVVDGTAQDQGKTNAWVIPPTWGISILDVTTQVVPSAAYQDGDIVVWKTGPTSGHIGIVANNGKSVIQSNGGPGCLTMGPGCSVKTPCKDSGQCTTNFNSSHGPREVLMSTIITWPHLGKPTIVLRLSGGSPWSRFHANNQNTGRGVGGGAAGSLKWKFGTGNQAGSSPAIGDDGSIYIGDEAGYVYSLSGLTGAVKWKFQTGKQISSCPAVAPDGSVYVGSDDSVVYALNGATGAPKWKFPTGDRVASSPAIGSDGTVYIGSDDKNLYALNGATGALKWAFPTGFAVDSGPAIGPDGTVYIGSDKVYALDPASGAVKWSFKTGGLFIFSAPVLDAAGVLYVVSADGGSAVPGSVSDHSTDGIYALSSATGAKLWFQPGLEISTPAIGSNGSIYVGASDGVYSLNAASGAVIWKYKTSGPVFSSPAVSADETVYVGSYDGNLFALNGAAGALLWSYKTGNTSSSPAIGADGSIYIGGFDSVYAFH